MDRLGQTVNHFQCTYQKCMECIAPTISQYNFLPQRVILSLFGFLAVVNAYTMRLCLDETLSHITSQESTRNAPAFERHHPVRKPLLKSSLKTPNLDERLKRLRENIAGTRKVCIDAPKDVWTPRVQSFAMASFYIGYVASHIPGAQLTERYGSKSVLAVSMTCSAILTLLTPLAIRVGGPWGLICMRILVGISEGPTFPALSALLAKWVPAKERGTLGVLVLSGSQIGISLSHFIATMLLRRGTHWSGVFYFFGVFPLIWVVCFIFLCHNEPESNPNITEAEIVYLRQEIPPRTAPLPSPSVTPWREIFSNTSVWALILGTVQHDLTQQMDLNSARFPHEELNEELSLLENLNESINSVMPYLTNWMVSLAAGMVSDFLFNYMAMSLTTTRKIMTLLVAATPELFSSGYSYIPPDMDPEHMFHYAIGVMGTYYASIKLAPLDLSPQYAGILMAIANGCGSLTGIVVPYIRDKFNEFTVLKKLSVLLWIFCTLFITGEMQMFDESEIELESTRHKNE